MTSAAYTTALPLNSSFVQHTRMFDDEGSGVVISDGRSGLRLSRIGEAGLGYPTLIDVQAGPFVGSVRDDTVGDYAAFAEQLQSLYDRLSGTAKLGSLEGFALVISGNGRGNIEVSGVVVGEHVPSVRLTFGFSIDQSYLPKIIRAIANEFPAAVQNS